MWKSVFRSLTFIVAFSLTGCALETSIRGEFLLENTFKMVKEFENGEPCQENDRWFVFRSSLNVHSDQTFEMSLIYNDSKEKTFEGQYRLFVGSNGQSGKGYFFLADEKITLTFEDSYFLYFDLPSQYNPEGSSVTRTLYFQRW